MIARGALLGLLDRLQEVRFSGSLELQVSGGELRSLELRQTAPFDLTGITLVQTEARPTCAGCGADMERDGACFKCPNCGELSGAA